MTDTTLRDQFAMAALPRSMEMVWENKFGFAGRDLDEMVARSAYDIADAMLKERKTK